MSRGQWKSPDVLCGRRVLTITQVCEMYQVSRRTVYNWMNSGKVEWASSPGGRRFIYADSTELRAGDAQ